MKRYLWLILIYSLGTHATIFERLAYPYWLPNKMHKIKEPPKTITSHSIKVPFQTAELSIHLWFRKTNSHKPVIIYFHGNATNIESLNKLYILLGLENLGLDFVVFDYPLYGLSKGTLNENTMIASGQAVFDFTQKTFPDRPIFIWGRSIGTGPAIKITHDNSSKVRGLILTSPFDNSFGLVKTRFNYLPEKVINFVIRRNTWESSKRVRSLKLPVLIHHGSNDQVITHKQGMKLGNQFPKENVKFISVEGFGHNDIFEYKFFWKDIRQFIKNTTQ